MTAEKTMPELPEVETTLRGITPHIKQKKITNIIVRQRQLRWPIPKNIEQILQDETIINIERKGKYLLLKMHKGALIIHLGMSGSLRILPYECLPRKHDHVDVVFQHKTILRFNDPRRFGAFLWAQGDPYQHDLLKKLGTEPLTRHFSGKYLWLQAQNKITPIKAFIMDSKIVTGIGNIYATEALFAAGIHPATPVKSLSRERLNKLTKLIKQILQHAIKKGGTTLKDFSNSEGKPGYFSQQLKVYGRAGQNCVVCHTVLQSMQIGQRNTAYCTFCQSR